MGLADFNGPKPRLRESGAIAGETGIPGKAIGAIRILDSYSFVEIPKEYASEVYTIMKERTIRNQPTKIEPAQGQGRRA